MGTSQKRQSNRLTRSDRRHTSTVYQNAVAQPAGDP
jgi:hypothetical protein